MRIALVVYDGVLADECDAFRSVLSLVRGAEVVATGPATGRVAGPGGIQPVDLTYDDLDHADVVVVPGGLGCERAADDPDLRRFLQRMGATARFLAASSTGSVVLASAGLLDGEPAATHWLAGSLLRRYGSEVDERRLAVRGRVITCEGRISAVDAAFAIAERLDGSDSVDRIRATLLERGRPHLEPAPWWKRRSRHRRGASVDGPATAHAVHAEPGSTTFVTDDAPLTPWSVMVELVPNDEQRRRVKRSRHR